MTAGSTSLDEGRSPRGALNLREDSGASDFKTIRTKKPEKGDSRSHTLGLRSPRASCSSVGKKLRLVLIKCSKHCPTLHTPAPGFQLSCAAESPPKVFRASSAIALSPSSCPPSPPSVESFFIARRSTSTSRLRREDFVSANAL